MKYYKCDHCDETKIIKAKLDACYLASETGHALACTESGGDECNWKEIDWDKFLDEVC